MQTLGCDRFLSPSIKEAKAMCDDGKLPAAGWEKHVIYNGKAYWLSWTTHGQQRVLWIRPTNWRREGNRLVLGGT